MSKITFQELKAKVDQYALDCHDELAASKAWSFSPSKTISWKEEDGKSLFPGASSLPQRMNDYAFSQICARLDAPPDRWTGDPKHCPEDLQISLLNSLAQIRPAANYLMRSKGDTVRAVLSDSYTKFDNAQLVDMAGEAINTMGIEPEVHRAEIGDNLRAYVLFPQVTISADPRYPHGGDGIHPAIYLRDSEIGNGGVRVAAAIFTSICMNGMIYGWKSNSDEMLFQRHRFISGEAMKLIVAEGVAVALKMSEEAAQNFIKAQEVHIPKANLKPIVTQWITKYGLTVPILDNWLAAVSSESASQGRVEDPRLFDLVNSATYVAQTLSSKDAQESMERMAGDLLRHNFSQGSIQEE